MSFKKTIALFAAFAMCLSMAACGSVDDTNAEKENKSGVSLSDETDETNDTDEAEEEAEEDPEDDDGEEAEEDPEDDDGEEAEEDPEDDDGEEAEEDTDADQIAEAEKYKAVMSRLLRLDLDEAEDVLVQEYGLSTKRRDSIDISEFYTEAEAADLKRNYDIDPYVFYQYDLSRDPIEIFGISFDYLEMVSSREDYDNTDNDTMVDVISLIYGYYDDADNDYCKEQLITIFEKTDTLTDVSSDIVKFKTDDADHEISIGEDPNYGAYVALRVRSRR